MKFYYFSIFLLIQPISAFDDKLFVLFQQLAGQAATCIQKEISDCMNNKECLINHAPEIIEGSVRLLAVCAEVTFYTGQALNDNLNPYSEKYQQNKLAALKERFIKCYKKNKSHVDSDIPCVPAACEKNFKDFCVNVGLDKTKIDELLSEAQDS